MILLINRSSLYVLRFDSVADAVRHAINTRGDWYIERNVRG